MRFNNDKPIFQQIAGFLEDSILQGKLQSGERLPSARELAESLEVNVNTAARALQELADSSLARLERGTGYFVAENAGLAALEEKKKEFFAFVLPQVFKTMNELKLGLKEVENAYNDFVKSKDGK